MTVSVIGNAMSSSPLPPHQHALELRHRAQVLRRLGRQLGGSPATTLALRAGPEVWAGPAAQQCLADLRRLAIGLRRSADAALVAAQHLEAQASSVEAAQRAGVVTWPV